jgi:hypothetical protein
MKLYLVFFMVISISFSLPIQEDLSAKDGIQPSESSTKLTKDNVDDKPCGHGKSVLVGTIFSCQCDKPHVNQDGLEVVWKDRHGPTCDPGILKI